MRIKANAKINLSLDITGKRPDGYHTLCSVFQSVSLSDELEITLSDSTLVVCSDPTLSGENNLCFKAAGMFFENTGLAGGASIFINKHIPQAGGLGGGSADAAAVLFALNELCGRPMTEEQLLDTALCLGADVPFCLKGGTRLCEGIGEKMTVLPSLPDCSIVIAKKGEKSSTKEMYRELDNAVNLRHPDTDSMIRGLRSGDLAGALSGAYNCFESVCDKTALSEARETASQNSACYCGLSGAGPSVISVFESLNNAAVTADILAKKGFEAFVCRPAETGLEIID